MQKKTTRTVLLAVLSAVLALLPALSGCTDILDPPRETAPADLPQGYGAVRVSLTQGAARTVMPEADLTGLSLEYLFARNGGAAEEKTPVDGAFILEPGNYGLTVRAFADSGLAAEGSSETEFAITAGFDAGTVRVALRPLASEGTGSLEFGLQYPAGVTVETLTLTRIAGEESFGLLEGASEAAGGGSVVLSGTRAGIPAGYYLLRALLKNGAGLRTGKSEVVHIYGNLTARTRLEDYAFSEEDFSAYAINTAEELAQIGKKLPADGAYALGRDLELTDWVPVTNLKDAPFTGTFLGNGRTITVHSFAPHILNIATLLPGQIDDGCIGVFGYIRGGRVENLTVDLKMPQEQAISAYSYDYVYDRDQYIGGVAGYAEDTDFEDITVLGDINLSKGKGVGKADWDEIYLGGVAGYLKGGGIAGSDSRVNLTGLQVGYGGGGGAIVGGFAGKADNAAITRSSGSGAVSAYANRGDSMAGGTAGYAVRSAFSYITVTGDIEASAGKDNSLGWRFSNKCKAGGIVGQSANTEITRCSSAGNVTAISYAKDGGNGLYVGGIGGLIDFKVVSDCYSLGNITARAADGTGEHTRTFAGGIAGSIGSNATIQKSYAAGIVTASSNRVTSSNPHAGGIVAFLDGYTRSGAMTVQQCAALSPQINWGLFARDGATLKRVALRGVYNYPEDERLGRLGQEMYPENTYLLNNIANRDMILNYEPSAQQAAKIPSVAPVPGPETEDGADCDAKPAQSVFEGLGWDFAAVWKMGSDGYPVFRWQ
jgi:hypothetical protein